MNILFAGKFEKNYNRTKIILDGLKYFPQIQTSFYNYSNRLKFNPFQFKKLAQKADVIFVPSFSHLDVPLIRFFTKKPIVFDPLISRYMSKVFDYKSVSEKSFRAYKNFLKDKLSMQAANIVLCDTEAHKQYFQSTFNIEKDKLKVLRVGVNTDNFYPKKTFERYSKKFVVGFYGSFIPLQGTKQIADAARLLANEVDIYFKLIGDGPEFNYVKNMALNTYQLKNIDFIGWANESDLIKEINEFDIALGIFGSSLKTDMVIPNKIYHYAAMQKAIITRDTTAIKEIFEDEENILLCNNDAESIAASILKLKNNREFRNLIAHNALQVAQEYNHKNIAAELINIIQQNL